ncbi:hypothetical protein BJX99DRAFT_256019 [Aspergillus californicus]
MPVAGDKSGEVDNRSHWLHFKAMVHVLVGPDSPSDNLITDINLLPSPTSPSAVLPIDSFGNILQSFSLGPSHARLVQQPDNNTLLKCKQLLMATPDHQVGTVEQCSSTPNSIPRQGVQTQEDQNNDWNAFFPMLESTRGKDHLPTSFRSRSASFQSPHQPTSQCSSPDIQSAVGDLVSSIGSDSIPDLLHPVPRQSSYTVTSYFSSENVSESISAFETMESPMGSHMSNDAKHLMQGSDWSSSSDLGFSCVLEDTKLLPGAPSSTTVAITEPYTATVGDGAYDNPFIVSSWTPSDAPVSWDLLPSSNARQDSDEALWNHPQVCSDIVQQNINFDQLSVSTDEINGLPWAGISALSYVQPSSLLDQYDPKPACVELTHPSSNNITTTPTTTTIVAPSEHGLIQSSVDTSAYQQSDPRPDDITRSLLESYAHISYQPDQPTRESQSSQLDSGSDSQNAFLINCKRRGYSYKEIKRIGGFREAESTLRGRYRTLTKSKEQRVRKPHWHDNDVSFFFSSSS